MSTLCLQVSKLSDVKVLLRDAAEREQDLLRQVRELSDKATLLEQFPAGTKGITDKKLVQDFQIQR